MPEVHVLKLGLILLVASVVALISRRFRLPYSVGLVAAGILLSLLPIGVDLELRPDLIFSVFLPPLIFEAALQIRWKPFRRDLPVLLTLAFFGLTLSAAVVALGMHALVGWGWLGAGLFGFLIAATDPVSVIAAFKEMKVEHRLSLLVESESLLNDGAAAVGFGLLVGIAGGSSASGFAMFVSLLWTVFGGIIVGAAITAALLLLAGRTEDHLVEITLTTIAAYGSFLIADHFHMSGVLASLTAGMIVGNVGLQGAISQSGSGHIVAFWEYAAFLANSIVFILIGAHEAQEPTRLFTISAAIAIVLVLLGRIAAVYPLSAVFAWSGLRVPGSYQHVLVWGGLRGALGLALALALPSNVPERSDIIMVAFAVVAFSIFVQGLTMPALIRHLGLTRTTARSP